MLFPDDHNWHQDVRVEWKYSWGRRPDGQFVHVATFKKNEKFFHHCSIDGRFQEFEGPDWFNIEFPTGQPIVEHNSKIGRYYSVPGNPWFDHCWSDQVGGDWKWLSLVLDCGMYVMAQDKPDDPLCDFTFGGKTVESDFVLEDKHFWLQELGAYWTIEPVKEEIIFYPKFGRPYSETGVELVAKGKVIGFGVLERTYKFKENYHARRL